MTFVFICQAQLETMGNSMGRAVYEANVPDNFRRPQTDSALESFIRAKYETKKYIAKEWVPQPPAKIDWEKEMEDEEKLKKKKKATSGAATTGVPIIPPPSTGDKKSSTNKTATIPPPLPKIGNLNSPKSNRSERKSATNGASDLLGLNTSNTSDTSSAPKASTDSNNDNFANFLSASPATTTAAGPTTNNTASQSKSESKPSSNSGQDNFTSLDKEEADFFNQTTADKEKSAKMTKDSILALYGSAPINPINNFNQGFNGVPATNFIAPSAIPGGTAAMFAQPNAFAQLPPTQQQQQIPQQYPTLMNNQFAPTAGQVPQMVPQFGMGPTMPHQWPPVMGQQASMHATQLPLGATIPSQMFNYHQPNSLPNVVHPVSAPTMAPPSDTMAKQFGSLNLNNLNNVWQ